VHSLARTMSRNESDAKTHRTPKALRAKFHRMLLFRFAKALGVRSAASRRFGYTGYSSHVFFLNETRPDPCSNASKWSGFC
jgi:hypothetical protein